MLQNLSTTQRFVNIFLVLWGKFYDSLLERSENILTKLWLVEEFNTRKLNVQNAIYYNIFSFIFMVNLHKVLNLYNLFAYYNQQP